MVNDPVGDFIIQLKNASAVGKDTASVPYSKLKHAIAEKLHERGYVKSVARRGKKEHKYLDVDLLYTKEGTSRIHDLKRVSRPGKRIYRSVSEIFSVKHGKGILVLSTPEGILTGEEARKKNVGGEALFMIW